MTAILLYSKSARAKAAVSSLPHIAKARQTVEAHMKDREPPEQQFPRVAKAWSALLGAKLKVDISPVEVGLMMIFLKGIRESSHHDPDNNVDIIGYALCTERVQKGEHGHSV